VRRLAVAPLLAFIALAVGFQPVAGAKARAQTSTTSTATAEPPAGLEVRLTEVPVDRRDDPRARSYIIDHVSPGATITRKIEVTNNSDRPGNVDLYASAAEVRDDNFVPLAGRTQNELSKWMTVDPGQVALSPSKAALATVTIAVPKDATAGERYAVAFAELPPPPDQTATVGVAIRVGIRVYLSVSSGGEPVTDFDVPTFTPTRAADGTPGVDIHACNSGGRAVDLTGDLSLSDGPGGTSAGPIPSASTVTLAPAQCGDVHIALDPKLPAGPWNATVTLRSGEKHKSATARVTFPAPGKVAVPVKTHAVRGTAKGRLAILIALLLLLLALGLLLLLAKRRRDKKEEDESSPA
jgi:hypothetical protein